MSLDAEQSIGWTWGASKYYPDPERPLKRLHKGKSRIDFPDSYVVIDLETTGLDPRLDSIIEVAGIRVENGQEIGRFQSLVRFAGKFDPYITELTGITAGMLESAPVDEQVLSDFLSFIGSLPVIGHNVNFDMNFLHVYASWLKRDFPNEYVDTIQLSRRLYPDLPNRKLATLVSYLGVDVQGAHRALEDCLAAQACFLKMKEDADRRGGIPKLDWEQFNALSKTITPSTTDFNMDGPIFGRSFAFTGRLERMTRKQAMQAVADAGGILCDGVVASTNYLVLGNNDYCKALQGGKSNKQKKVEKMQLEEADILVISEDVFYDMLQDSKLPEGGSD